MSQRRRPVDCKKIGKDTYILGGYGAPSNQASKILPKFRRALGLPEDGRPMHDADACPKCQAAANCADHDPNSGPGSDWCPNCDTYACTLARS